MDKEKYGNVPFEKEDILELHKLRVEWFKSKNLEPSAMTAYLSCEFVGSLALCGYSEDFVKKTFERMLEKFKNHPMRK